MLSKPASWASFTAASASRLSWMRPSRCRQPSSKLWMPKLRRLTSSGQLVVRDMRRLQRERALQVGAGAGQVLAGQGVHQVEVDVVEAGVLGQLHRRLGLAAVVDAAQSLQAAVVEALDAEAQAVD